MGLPKGKEVDTTPRTRSVWDAAEDPKKRAESARRPFDVANGIPFDRATVHAHVHAEVLTRCRIMMELMDELFYVMR